ncbi:hypothetical protein [Pseudoxanthomonas composti]|uniref:Uncharacterized protein n=1 Tax=Pseudoxanthomonas composti TaxID=2137479 RepID=A0A4Q1JSD4_9GAMM|nr:hypothetical protein [Pseudoxanthomonas composti]RXQ99135.1 hypothetical protein EPA99_18125 [Pseudoxanthomonas composti]
MTAVLAVIACLIVGVCIAIQRRALRTRDLIASPGQDSPDHAAARQALEAWMDTLRALETPLREGDRDALRTLLRQQPLQAPAALVAAVDNPAFPVRDAESVLRLLHLAEDLGTLLDADRDLLDQRRALEAFLRTATLLHQALTCSAACGDALQAPPQVAVGV